MVVRAGGRKQTVEEFLKSGGEIRKLPLMPSNFPRKSDPGPSHRRKKKSYSRKSHNLRMGEKKKRQEIARKLERLGSSERLKKFSDQQKENRNWSELQVKAFLDETGLEFRYQCPLGPYIPDFYFPRQRVILEIDGTSHRGREVYDAKRDAYFEKHGITTLRVKTKHLSRFLSLTKSQFAGHLGATARSRIFTLTTSRKKKKRKKKHPKIARG